MNNVIQWAGTACFMVMYTVMSYFKELHTLQLLAGCLGGMLYLLWSVRVANKPQMITNLVRIAITLGALYKALG